MPPAEVKPTLNIPVTKQERKALGVDQSYVDDYIQAQTLQYNNDFNEYMWNLNNEYNSPLAQRQRLEVAGLNPNFNAVNTGNSGSPVQSSGRINSNVVSNEQARTQNTISAFNALIGAIGQGIKATSEISGIPNDISSYRKLLTTQMRQNVDKGEWNNINTIVDTIFNSAFKGADLGNLQKTTINLGQDEFGNEQVISVDPMKSRAMALQGLLEVLRKDQHGLNLTDQELKNANKVLTEARAGLVSSQTTNQDFVNSVQAIDTGIKWLDGVLKTLVPLIIKFGK